MSKHKMLAICPFGLDGIQVTIAYTFTKGAPEQGPNYASGGQPADPDEVELISVTYANPLNDEMAKMLEAWAVEYLADEGFADAIENATDDSERDYDRALDAYERRQP
jgi:hypothetical protein